MTPVAWLLLSLLVDFRLSADVVFEDPAVQAAVAHAVNRPNATNFTPSELLLAKKLTVSGATNLAGIGALVNLESLELSEVGQALSIPVGLLNLRSLAVRDSAKLTQLGLPPDLPNLGLLAIANTGLLQLDLGFFGSSLTNIDISGNRDLRSFRLSAKMTNLQSLYLIQNGITSLEIPGGLNTLATIQAPMNALTNVEFSGDLPRLFGLNLSENLLSDLTLPGTFESLRSVNVSFNRLKSVDLSAIDGTLGLALNNNQLTNIQLGKLTFLRLYAGANELTSFVLPETLVSGTLWLDSNPLQTLSFPNSLKSLDDLSLGGTPSDLSLVFPPGVTNLPGISVYAGAAPRTIIVPETAVRNDPVWFTTLSQSPEAFHIFVYPLAVSLEVANSPKAAFSIRASGPPGVYALETTSSLRAWSRVGSITNTTGTAVFETTSATDGVKFFRLLSANTDQ